VYPTEAYKNKTVLPFLAFAHGMTAGGAVTYTDYGQLWDTVCSYGYIILGPKSCPDLYCQKFYEDVTHTITTAQSEKGKLDPVLEYADYSRIGVYGHSMGGGATVHVSDNKNLNLVAAVALHPAVVDDSDKNESKDVKIPMLWFTGSSDDIVPPKGVWTGFEADPILPKICAEIKGATHFDPTDVGKNLEDPYVASYFDCHIKQDANACHYFYSDGPDNICTGGPPMTRCEIHGNNTALV
jgi:predicted dienelactone hydrolase